MKVLPSQERSNWDEVLLRQVKQSPFRTPERYQCSKNAIRIAPTVTKSQVFAPHVRQADICQTICVFIVPETPPATACLSAVGPVIIKTGKAAPVVRRTLTRPEERHIVQAVRPDRFPTRAPAVVSPFRQTALLTRLPDHAQNAIRGIISAAGHAILKNLAAQVAPVATNKQAFVPIVPADIISAAEIVMLKNLVLQTAPVATSKRAFVLLAIADII